MHLFRLVVCLLPPSRLKNRLLAWTPGWSVDPSCRISPILVWRVVGAELGVGVRIGAGNIFRELRLLRLEERSEIGQFNWISAAARYIPRTTDEDLRGVFWLAPHATIASRHYIDASGGVRLDEYAVLGGVRTTVLSHSLDVRDDALALSPVRIGARSVVFTNCTLVPGATVGPQIAVAANSVVTGVIEQAETLFAGAPAKPASNLAGARFFRRTGARIIPTETEDVLRREMREGDRRS